MFCGLVGHMADAGIPELPRPQDEPRDAARPEAPELVIGLVSPLGAPAPQIIEALKSSLRSFSYSTSVIKLSALLRQHAVALGIEDVPDGALAEHDRVETLMNLGDELCTRHEDAAAVLALGIDEIRTLRIEQLGNASSSAVSRHAWILDSLKRPAEVTALREVYGDHAIVLAIGASRESRIETLYNKIKPSTPMTQDEQIRVAAESLLARDQSGASTGRFGQDVVKTFPLADVFVQAAEDVNRFVCLLFGDPEHPGPSTEEHGMQLASVAATRSPELGLKVGAALLVDDDIVSLGANAHPVTPGESPAFDTSKVEIEKLVGDTLIHLSHAGILTAEVSTSLDDDADKLVKKLLEGPLKGAAVRALTEFQQTVHAEMTALLGALKQGRAVDGARMYVTTYPCHNCAKHLLRLGITVTYLEPYPKSRAEAMYGVDASQFAPYRGVAPRRFMEWFVSTEDRKGPDGTRLTWTEEDRAEALPVVDRYIDHEGILARESWFVQTMQPEGAETSEPLDTQRSGDPDEQATGSVGGQGHHAKIDAAAVDDR